MDRNYIDEHNIIERYLLGKLSDEEASAFEDVFAFDKELCNEIDAVEKLIHGLHAAEKGESRSATSRSTTPIPARDDQDMLEVRIQNDGQTASGNWSPKRRFTGKLARHLPMALAANVVLAVAVTLLFFENRQLSRDFDPVDSQVNGPVISLEITRSSAAVLPTLDYNEGWVTLLISGVSPDARLLTLRLLDDRRTLVLEETGVELNPLDPWIEWLVRGSLLSPGVYELELLVSEPSTYSDIVSLSFEICGGELGTNSSCRR